MAYIYQHTDNAPIFQELKALGTGEPRILIAMRRHFGKDKLE